MILLAVLFHNIQFFLFHLLAEVLPEVQTDKFYVKETVIQEDQFVPHFSLIYNFPML